MLVLVLRTLIVYIFLLVIMRFMGKRQLSQLQPFEFVIALILAELAAIPMSESSIPIIYGLIPIFSIFILHVLLTIISKKSMKFRRAINGLPQIIISRGNIVNATMQKLGLNVNDILEALRNQGYFSPLDVEYAIVETNGTMNVLPKSSSRPVTPKDMSISITAPSVPYTLVVEGKIMERNLTQYGTSIEKLKTFLKENSVNSKDILLLTVDAERTVYLQPYSSDFKTLTANL